jgi:hypothetical protein
VNYKDYLKTKHWKNKREEVLMKQGNKCRICGSEIKIQIHHRRYKLPNGDSVLGKEPNCFLLPVCNDCHSLWHKLKGFKKIPFPTLRRKLRAGIPKEIAFKHSYTKIENLQS